MLGAHWATRVEEAWDSDDAPGLGSAFEPLCDPATAPMTNMISVAELHHLAPSAATKRYVDSGMRHAVEVRLSPGLRSAVLRIAFESVPERWDSHNADVVMLLGTIIMSTLRRCQAEERLSERARRDPLTGLLNRDDLYKSLSSWISSPRQSGRVGVLYVDVDHFKLMNDRLGHAVGDDLLRALAEVMEDSVREGDVVARMGGDEFVAVCRDLDSPQQLDSIACRISERVGRLQVGHTGVLVSIGAAVWTPDLTADDLIGVADAAMYRDKRSRRGTTG